MIVDQQQKAVEINQEKQKEDWNILKQLTAVSDQMKITDSRLSALNVQL